MVGARLKLHALTKKIILRWLFNLHIIEHPTLVNLRIKSSRAYFDTLGLFCSVKWALFFLEDEFHHLFVTFKRTPVRLMY